MSCGAKDSPKPSIEPGPEGRESTLGFTPDLSTLLWASWGRKSRRIKERKTENCMVIYGIHPVLLMETVINIFPFPVKGYRGDSRTAPTFS
ncbi:MAG: hypothetical protein D3919_16005 [Candidatus Electrothrix sp. AW5]|nr:hypothetical protein [Candidatus Electrothrix gigas]